MPSNKDNKVTTEMLEQIQKEYEEQDSTQLNTAVIEVTKSESGSTVSSSDPINDEIEKHDKVISKSSLLQRLKKAVTKS